MGIGAREKRLLDFQKWISLAGESARGCRTLSHRSRAREHRHQKRRHQSFHRLADSGRVRAGLGARYGCGACVAARAARASITARLRTCAARSASLQPVVADDMDQRATRAGGMAARGRASTRATILGWRRRDHTGIRFPEVSTRNGGCVAMQRRRSATPR